MRRDSVADLHKVSLRLLVGVQVEQGLHVLDSVAAVGGQPLLLIVADRERHRHGRRVEAVRVQVDDPAQRLLAVVAVLLAPIQEGPRERGPVEIAARQGLAVKRFEFRELWRQCPQHSRVVRLRERLHDAAHAAADVLVDPPHEVHASVALADQLKLRARLLQHRLV